MKKSKNTGSQSRRSQVLTFVQSSPADLNVKTQDFDLQIYTQSSPVNLRISISQSLVNVKF